MAKRTLITKKSQVDDRLVKGRGNIEKGSYVPFLFIHDVPSLGKVSRISFKGRTLHLLSQIEVAAAIEAIWCPNVVEIYEQVALADFYADPPNVRETELIAEEMGIAHPTLLDGSPNVFTTDLVVRYVSDDGGEKLRAISVKPLDAVTLTEEQKRKPSDEGVWGTLHKLEIERRYWLAHDVEWFLVTDADFGRERTKNIETFLGAPEPESSSLHPGWENRLTACLLDNKLGSCTIEEIYREQGRLQEFGSLAELMGAIAWLCRSRRIEFDLNSRFDERARLFSFGGASPLARTLLMAGAN